MTTTAPTRTGAEIVQNLPWRWGVQGKIFIIGGLGFMFDAWDVILNAFLFPLLKADWGLSAAQLGWLGTTNLIGMAIGAILLGGIADIIGRKKVFTYSLLIFAALSVLSAGSPNYEVFIVLRFLAGVGLGGCIPVDYAIVGEFTPSKVRGRALTAMDAWWPIGATICGLVAAFLAAQGVSNWRLLLLFMVLPALLVVWVRRGIPESPMYLLRRGREAEAREIIDNLVRRTGAEAHEYVMGEPEPAAPLSIKSILNRVGHLWKFDWKVTFISWALFSSVLFVYYGALIWLPSILRDTKYSEYVAFMVTTGVTAVGIIGVLVSAYLVDWFGRKKVIFGSAVLTTLSIILFAIFIESPGPAKFWILAFGIVIEFCIPAIYCYCSELYPTELRASGFGWASSASRIVSALVPVAFGSLLFPFFGYVGTFAIAGGLLVIVTTIMLFLTPETKGRLIH
ncbi:putative MFS transporter [Antricoccus suffuscus]|uniref:Putative MFS transporter n=1 Tax=Antricoccus suffuscus TaxID=1629062 RepID=A0A2T0ZXL0_9ACTN|nr:MFS transporter [Antricoccus suffuscus]PRZ40977.1 putative MFS transporter [Antricoccus suffuscus]